MVFSPVTNNTRLRQLPQTGVVEFQVSIYPTVYRITDVILSERSESKDLRMIVAAQQFSGAKIPRLRAG